MCIPFKSSGDHQMVYFEVIRIQFIFFVKSRPNHRLVSIEVNVFAFIFDKMRHAQNKTGMTCTRINRKAFMTHIHICIHTEGVCV